MLLHGVKKQNYKRICNTKEPIIYLNKIVLVRFPVLFLPRLIVNKLF